MLKRQDQRAVRSTLIMVVLFVLIGILFASGSCTKSNYSGKVEIITIGQAPTRRCLAPT